MLLNVYTNSITGVIWNHLKCFYCLFYVNIFFVQLYLREVGPLIHTFHEYDENVPIFYKFFFQEFVSLFLKLTSLLFFPKIKWKLKVGPI